MSYLERRLAKSLLNEEFKKEWNSTELEYVIAKNMIERRLKLGLTQSDLAARMKTKQSVISRIESGQHNMTLDSLKAVASILQTDVPSLMQSEGHDMKKEKDLKNHRLVRA